MESNNQNENQERKNLKSKLNDLKEQLSTPAPLPFDNEQISDGDELGYLNEKQLRFCIEYIKDQNGTKSAIRAGYAEKSAAQIASELLTLPKVQNEIQRRLELIARANNITKEYVQTQLIELIQDCYNDEKTDRTSILKALDMLSKMNGLYTPDTQVNIQNNVTDGEIKIVIVKPETNE